MPGRFPVILTQTGYNKSVPVFRTSNAYFVQRGYIHVSVDVRGTGQSEGSWEAFSETEQADYSEVLDWIIARKREQYRRSRRHDVFACGWTAGLLHTLFENRSPDFGLRVSSLRTAAGEERVRMLRSLPLE